MLNREVDMAYEAVRVIHEQLPVGIQSYGFRILQAPPRVGGLTICGLNAGGNETEFSEQQHAGPPEQSIYEGDLKGRRYATTTWKWYSEIGRTSDLLSANKLNALFFRSESYGKWKELWQQEGTIKRKQVEKTCCEHVIRLLMSLEPQALVIDGLTDTLTILQQTNKAEVTFEVEVARVMKRGHLTFCNGGSIPLLAVSHPSGGIRTSQETQLLVCHLSKFLEKNLCAPPNRWAE